MAEPANKIVLATVQSDCISNSCPYRYGDQSYNERLLSKLEKKLKYRVADGNEVRALKRRVDELEIAVSQVLEIADKKKISQQDIAKLRVVLQKGGPQIK